MKFEAGQEVILVKNAYQRKHQFERAHIHRVGRKYAYVIYPGWQGEIGFDIETGREKGSHAAPDYIYTLEAWSERLDRRDAEARLQEHGITYVGYGGFEQDTPTLQAIVGILDERQNTGKP